MKNWSGRGALVVLAGVTIVLGLLPIVSSQATAATPEINSGAAKNATADAVPEITGCPDGEKTTKVGTSAADALDVWACGDGKTMTEVGTSVIGMLNGFYSRMTELMGGPPLPDKEVWKGEDTNIDLYLLSSGQQVHRSDTTTKISDTVSGQAVPTDKEKGSTAASGWIAVDASERTSNPAYFDQALAHELFHLEQFRTNVGDCGSNNWWFVEASATWAGAHYPPDSAPLVYPRFQYFEMDPAMSLNDTADDASKVSHSYSAFIWPFFMEQQAGTQSIGDVWRSLKNVTTCAAMDEALNKVFPFATNFKKFALENLDGPLPNYNSGTSVPKNFGETYQNEDHAFHNYYPTLAMPNTQSDPMKEPTPYTLPADPSKDSYPFITTVPTKLPTLSTQYNFFKISPDYNDVQFDFSKLPESDTDVTLIGQEEGGTETTYTVAAATPGDATPLNFSGASAHVCLALDLKSQFGGFGESPQGQGAAFWVVVDNHSLSNTPVDASYSVTVRKECAGSVSGTLTDKEVTTVTQGTDPVITQVTTENDTWNVQLKDSKDGFNPKGTSVTSSGTVVTGPLPGCDQLTGIWSGTATVYPGGTAFYGFGPRDITPQFDVTSNVGTGTLMQSGCGTPSSGPWGGNAIGSFCLSAAESSYANSARTALTFICSDPFTSGFGEGTLTGGGTLTAKDVDACGLWTSGCSIKQS